ncbi:hypothetical protein R1flu_003122 [Riccia fluitans]|uniref:Uncharacterized protein n=1 Tax=Riccia fluitans TaxID=41844 RepID=A0ABD1Y830_9MARC
MPERFDRSVRRSPSSPMVVRSYPVQWRQNQPMKGLPPSTPASYASSKRFGANLDGDDSANSLEGQDTQLKTFVYDPATDSRGRSIATHMRVPIGETLVTDIVYPRPPPEDFDRDKPEMRAMSPSECGRESRRRIEESLKMYPRNTWGPVTKWGHLDLFPLEITHKHHFKGDHDKEQKERLEQRKFGFQRHWIKYKNMTNMWEDSEAPRSLAYAEPRFQFEKDAEKYLHALNDQRIAKDKRMIENHRNTKRWREYNRLERGEDEYLRKIENEAMLRKDPGWRVNFSSVNYDIVTLGYSDGHAGDKLKYTDLVKKWRESMRALRLQSKQSGTRMYDVVTWKPQRPCSLPLPKPERPVTPTQDNGSLPSPRMPEVARPRNMLHSLDKVEDVPIASTNDVRTNW